MIASLLLLGSTLGWAHGGIPAAEEILQDPDGLWTISTTHGLFFEDGGWDWVCEEITGEAFATDIIRTADGLRMATTSGILQSPDGCAWSVLPSLAEELVVDLLPAPDGTTWAVTYAGLWHAAQDDFTWISTPTPEASVRAAVLTDDGARLYALGFEGDAPMVWSAAISGTSVTWETAVPLPAEGGRMEALGTDPLGRGYARFPTAAGTDQLVRFSADGGVALLLEPASNISAFFAGASGVYVSVVGWGTVASFDDGQSWTSPARPELSCLTQAGGQWIGCPGDGSAVWSTEDADVTDPNDWAWAPGLLFSEVSGPRCAEPAVAQVCDPLWETVGEELGVTTRDTGGADTAAPADPAAPSAGCQAAAGHHRGGLLLVGALVGMGCRRRG